MKLTKPKLNYDKTRKTFGKHPPEKELYAAV
jgi:hypothetical protein